MKPRHTVLLVMALTPSMVYGQGSEDWRTRFEAGLQGRSAGDFVAYADEMNAAAALIPPGQLNRPFTQYHAARAAALANRPTDAIEWLSLAWEEDIEALMISFAPFDPAFDDLRADPTHGPEFREVMGRAASIVLDVRRLGDGVYVIAGTGANVVAQIGVDGVLLVDTGYAPALPALRRALAALGRTEVDRLLVTHAHEDHLGGTPGLGAEATVLAHPETSVAMREPYLFMEGVETPPKPSVALPDVEVAGDTTFVFNGEEIRIFTTEAHTQGDLTVYFAGSRVAHFGDTYLGGNPMMYPGQDDPDAFLDRLDDILDSMHGETVVVSGHDEPVGIAAVRRQIEQSRACMAWVRDAIGEGLSVEEAASRGTDLFPPQWIGFFYQLFTQGGA